jgi:hypothetical protein
MRHVREAYLSRCGEDRSAISPLHCRAVLRELVESIRGLRNACSLGGVDIPQWPFCRGRSVAVTMKKEDEAAGWGKFVVEECGC